MRFSSAVRRSTRDVVCSKVCFLRPLTSKRMVCLKKSEWNEKHFLAVDLLDGFDIHAQEQGGGGTDPLFGVRTFLCSGVVLFC